MSLSNTFRVMTVRFFLSSLLLSICHINHFWYILCMQDTFAPAKLSWYARYLYARYLCSRDALGLKAEQRYAKRVLGGRFVRACPILTNIPHQSTITKSIYTVRPNLNLRWRANLKFLIRIKRKLTYEACIKITITFQF